MTSITPQQVKELRRISGAGIIDAKNALQDSDGNMEAAMKLLQKKGAKIAEKKADRDASEGLVEAYIHCGGSIGVLIELNCETDFVAKNEKFKELAHNIAMHIAAMDPKVIHPQDLPEEEKKAQEEIFAAQLKEEGKPQEMIGKIMEGKMKKWAQEQALMTQAFVKNPDQTIEQIVIDAIGQIGENIKVHRFARFDIKGTVSLCNSDEETK